MKEQGLSLKVQLGLKLLCGEGGKGREIQQAGSRIETKKIGGVESRMAQKTESQKDLKVAVKVGAEEDQTAVWSLG